MNGERTPKRRTLGRSFLRFLRYLFVRSIAVFIAIVIGIFLTIVIANMGGYVDKIKRAEIEEQISIEVYNNPQFKYRPREEVLEYIRKKVELEVKRQGLDKPFITWPLQESKAFKYLADAITLRLGRAENMHSDSGSKGVWIIIRERLPTSIMLFTTANLLVFFAGIFLALCLSRRYGSLGDRLSVALAPLSAAPPWFYGIILILIFAAILRLLPFGGLVDAPPPETGLGYALSVLKHMVLPLLAWFISLIFITVYNWRTFFLIYSSEDYVEMAKAKGLSSRAIERRYVMRPTLPTIITSFSLMLIAAWMGAIITETVFNWPGIGRLYYQAIGMNETAVIVGLTVIYAYLLGITVLLLDVVYALVDPRIKVGGGTAT